jgi:spore coat polysaccharide biosynthesis predicted glycosyltransferase SpsG
MRCLTLARAFRRAGRESLFVTAIDADQVGKRKIENFGFTCLPAGGGAGSDAYLASLLPLLLSKHSVLIADNRNISARYLVNCRKLACTVYLDDDAAWTPPADIVINGNVGITAEHYRCDADGPTLLIGPDYNLVREEFFSLTPAANGGEPHVLITLGGEDPFNHTAWILRNAAAVLRTAKVTVVVGPAHPD